MLGGTVKPPPRPSSLRSVPASLPRGSRPELGVQAHHACQRGTTKEIIETSQDIAKIFSGQVVNAPEGANSQLRLQVVQQWITGTPEIPAEDVQARMQEDEKFAQRIQTYVGQLEFMQTQQKNALVGQLGTAPGNVLSQSEQSEETETAEQETSSLDRSCDSAGVRRRGEM